MIYFTHLLSSLVNNLYTRGNKNLLFFPHQTPNEQQRLLRISTFAILTNHLQLKWLDWGPIYIFTQNECLTCFFRKLLGMAYLSFVLKLERGKEGAEKVRKRSWEEQKQTIKWCHLPPDLWNIHATTHSALTHDPCTHSPEHTQPQTHTRHLSWCLGNYLGKLSNDLSHSSPA